MLIVTNNESHWRDMAQQLKEKEILFYPETREEFNELRNLCHFAFCHKEECVVESISKIRKIISKLPENFSCIIKYQITEGEGDAFANGVLFFKFYEKFLINNSELKLIVYFEYGCQCTCEDCFKNKMNQLKVATVYCAEKEIPFYCWSEDLHFFVEDWQDLSKPVRNELSIDLLK